MTIKFVGVICISVYMTSTVSGLARTGSWLIFQHQYSYFSLSLNFLFYTLLIFFFCVWFYLVLFFFFLSHRIFFKKRSGVEVKKKKYLHFRGDAKVMLSLITWPQGKLLEVQVLAGFSNLFNPSKNLFFFDSFFRFTRKTIHTHCAFFSLFFFSLSLFFLQRKLA